MRRAVGRKAEGSFETAGAPGRASENARPSGRQGAAKRERAVVIGCLGNLRACGGRDKAPCVRWMNEEEIRLGV